MKKVLLTAVVSLLMTAGAAAWGDTQPLPVAAQRKSAGVQLWANGPYWAESNLGATNREDGGKLFSFGEATAAITAQLGSEWRLPTKTEFDALYNVDGKSRCRWKWDASRHGVVITGLTDGYTDKSIFLPAAGCNYGTGVVYAGSFGRYWTGSSLGDERTWSFFFGPHYYYMNDNANGNRLSVRAVRSAPTAGADNGESEVERETISSNALISVKPHLQLIGETSVGVAWTTRVEADGWVEWSQDGGATWRKAWNQRDGLKVDANDRIHKIVVEGFDPAKPLKYRVRSRACTSFGQCEVGHSGEEGMYEGILNALRPADGTLSFAVLNDVHGQLETYPKMLGIKEATKGLSLTVFNGDLVACLVNDQDSFARSILGPLAYCTAHAKAPVRYLRGNHDSRGAYSRHMRDHLALQNDRYYGAVTLGRTRLVFLDPGEDKADDHVEYSGLVDFEGYLAEQTAWLKREVESPAWKDARFRVVITHIPPDLRLMNKENKVWKQPLPRICALYDVFERAGTTLVISAHLHHRVLRPAGDLHPYAQAAGGGRLNDKGARREATLTRCDVLEDRIVVRQFTSDGCEVERMEVK